MNLLILSSLGTSDQVRYLEKFCKKIMPNFTFYFMNFADLDRSKKSNLYSLDENGDLLSRNNNIPLIYKIVDNNPVYDFFVSNFHTIAFLRKSYVVVQGYNIFKKNKNILITFQKKLQNIK